MSEVSQRSTKLLRMCVLTFAVLANEIIEAHSSSVSQQQLLPATPEDVRFVQMPPQHRILPARKSFIGLCTIAKDRHEDVVEWLVHHIAVGVGHFYIYDDHSDPPLRDLLEPWIQSNLVTYLKMTYDRTRGQQTVDGKPVHWQVKAYNHCLDAFSIRHEWLGFIDSDEFIYLPSPQHPSMHNLLLKEFDRYSGLAVNWVVYGSSGHVQRPKGTVMHSYSKCIPGNATKGNYHTHVKLLMHVAHGQNMATFHVRNPHQAKPTGKAHPNATPHAKTRAFGPVVDELKRTVKAYTTKTASTSKIAMLHYRLKSLEEYKQKYAHGYAWRTTVPSYFKWTDALATADCTLPDVPNMLRLS